MLSITPSLYSAFYYYAVKDLGKTKEDFLKVLRKEPSEPTESMLAGIQLEDRIKDIADGVTPFSNNIESEVAKIVEGGTWQYKLGKEFNGYYLYGRADVIKGDTIYDIKFCNSYDLNKYEYSIQHLIYCYAMGINKFRYLIVEKGKNLYTEDYYFDKYSHAKLLARTQELIGFIDGYQEFKEIFESNWVYKK